MPFSLDAGKGKCSMWLVNKVEFFFEKVGFTDSKWYKLIILFAYARQYSIQSSDEQGSDLTELRRIFREMEGMIFW